MEPANVLLVRVGKGVDQYAALWQRTVYNKANTISYVLKGRIMAQNAPTERVIYPENVPGLRKDWTYTTGGAIESSPAVAGGVVYVGSHDNNLYAFDAKTGKKLWSYVTGNPIYSSP